MGNQKIQEIAEFLDRPWIHSGMQIIAIFAHFFLPVNGIGTLKMKSCITSFIYVREWHQAKENLMSDMEENDIGIKEDR